jgi:hypothetical protein
MTIGRNFGFFRNKHMGYGGEPADFPAFTIAVSYSGASALNTRDTNIITYTITSNVKNTTIYYTMEDLNGNLQANDFADNTLSGTIALDANGSGTVTKTLVKSLVSSEGHKKFKLRLRRTSISGFTLKESANTQVYEVIPITASGGNTTIVPFTTTGFSSVVGAKFHSFSNAATETFTITDYGNYTGNANVWVDQFVTPGFTYWDTGLQFRNMIVGGGGAGLGAHGGGAGEIGFWTIPIGNLATGSYSMKVGRGLTTTDTGYNSDAGNTTAFLGNVTYQIIAFGGGRGGGSPGGCGGGGTTGGFTAAQAGNTQLPAKTSLYYPTTGSAVGFGMSRTAGAGGGGVTAPGLLSQANGGTGWSANTFSTGYTVDAQWQPNVTPIQYAGGGGGTGGSGSFGGGNSGQVGTKGTGAGGGAGANGGQGLVALRYPYAAAYRFATANVIV